MAVESSQGVALEALESQAAAMRKVFTEAGFELVAPAILQPADVFLDVVGEALRGRTYVFTDPDGTELCLRPDLTVPTARAYLARYPKADVRARYCYDGPTFRFQRGGGDTAHPREFRQVGVEAFGHTDREKMEAEIVALAIAAVEAAGLKSWRLRFGDLGLFQALLGALEMPERWRARLKRNFWRRHAFRAELERLGKGFGDGDFEVPGELLDALDPADPEAAEEKVAAHLESRGIPLIGTRSLSEITARLLDQAADRRAPPLTAQAVKTIEDYVAIKAPPKAAGARIDDLMSERGVDIGPALESYRRRLELFREAGIDLSVAEFSAEFGRNLEYYTGFVFELEVASLGAGSHIAGGGRYDNLLAAVGAPHEVPGVGLAIHTERLLLAVEEGL